MKTSKCFLSTLIAAAAVTATAYAEGETIGINFNSGSGSVDGWNNTTGASGTVTNLVETTGTKTNASVVYSCSNTWGDSGNTDAVLKGYLDDSNISVSVSGISYLTYDLTVIAASDQGSGVFRYYTVNGVNYYGSEGLGIEGTSTWGNTDTGTLGNDNSFVVSNLSGNILLTTPGRSGSERSCLAGLVITNTYAGTATSVALDGTGTNWTKSAIGSTTWTNSTAEAGTYAAFNLTADTAVNVTEVGIVTDAITASGSGVLTLSGEAVTLINAGVVRTDSDTASIIVNNNLNFSSFGSVFGNVTINGTATFSNGGNLGADVVLGESAKASVTGGTLFIAATPSSGTIEVSKDAMVSLTTSQSGSVDATNISGSGTFAVAFDTSYAGTINITNTEFTGDIYVSSGYFTVNNAKFNDTLRLGDGVRFQLTGGSSVTFSKNLVLEGTTEVHQNGGATLVFDADSSVKGTGTYVRKGGGTLTFSGDVDLGGFNTGSNATTNFSGTTKLESLTVSQGIVNISGSATEIGTLYIAGNGATTFSSDATVGTIQVSGNSATSGALTIDSEKTISATSMNNGWGLATLTVNGALDISDNMTYATGNNVNTITGAGTISTKTLTVGNDGKYQLSGGVTLKIGSGGIQTTNVWGYQLRIGDSTLSASEDWRVSDSNTSGHIKLNSTENGGAKFDTNGHTITFGAALQDLSESEIGALTKKGEGTLTLSGDNTYTGGTTISAGTLVAASSTALGSGNVKVEFGATLSLGTSAVSVKNLSGAGTINLADGTTESTITATYDSDTELSANISAGEYAGERGWLDNGTSINFVKDGSATLVLTQMNTFFGDVTIKSGTLHAVNSSALSGGDVVVSSGATLKLNPSADAWGTVANSFDFKAGSTLVVDLGYVAMPAETDASNTIAIDVITSSAITFGDTTLSAGESLTLPEGYVTFANDGILSTYVNQIWSYDGTNLSLTLAIPEPSLFGLLAGLGALSLVGTRRRRR